MLSFFTRLYSSFRNEGDQRVQESFVYNEKGYCVHSSSPKVEYAVSVVIPVYNSENTLEKTIQSVVDQSIGFNKIELILLDDKSTDTSRELIRTYTEQYPNVVAVFFAKNNGSPAIPRNTGIDLAKGKYVMFIDSDDWLSRDGIEKLYQMLERTGNPYGIGRTIKVEDSKLVITGEYNSCKERDEIRPCEIPHIFQHMGPTARMMRTEFLREHNCRFPNMKFAEDKQFFIDVLTNCPAISTTSDVIYYVNRYKDNKSLVSTTSIFEKTDTNITVIQHVISKQLPVHIEKMVLNRLYEFDCITRLFNRHHFLRSKNKERYYEKFAEVLETTKGLRYDFTENFFEPWHKVLVDLFRKGQYDQIVSLIEWSLKDTTKETVIQHNLPYYRLPLAGEYELARMKMAALYHSQIKDQHHLKLKIDIYGDHLDQLNCFVIRQRENELQQIEFPIHHVSDHRYEVPIKLDQLAELSPSSHVMFIQYCDYRKLHVKVNARRIFAHQGRQMDFYTTIGDNIGLNMKQA